MRQPLAVITGASTGIGYELACECARRGYDLVVAADESEIKIAAGSFRMFGGGVLPVVINLDKTQGVDQLLSAIGSRPVDLLLANAGRGLGSAFLDQDFEEIRRVIDTNLTGTVYLLHRVGRRMRDRGAGRILITGSIAGYLPGPFEAVYNGTKAFLNSFALALRNELKDSGITVTCLMPGVTEAEFFRRADMLDTKLAQSDKDSAASVAKAGVQALIDGNACIVPGAHNKFYVAAMNVLPAEFLAEHQRKMTEPDSSE